MSNLPDVDLNQEWEEAGEAPNRRLLGSAWRELVGTLLPAMVLALLLNHFVLQTRIVYGQSMEPNLHTDQRLIIDLVTYRLDNPERGDVVVVEVQGSEIPLIKRVIGLPGEEVEIEDNRVWVNGELLDEPYLPELDQADHGPVQVPDGMVFVMGDNREHSRDSRSFGPVGFDQIIGRAWASYWPPTELHFVQRW